MKTRYRIDGPEDDEGDELVDKLYVARWLGISVGMVDELRRQKKLRAIKVGRKVRFERAEVKRYLRGELEGGNGNGAGAAVTGNGGEDGKAASRRGGRRVWRRAEEA